MRVTYILIFLFFHKNILSLELACKFEEVYQTGEIQQGLFLVKGEKFRYQYSSKNLYSIIHNQNKFFLIENRDTSVYFVIDKNTDILEIILEIIHDYPNFKSTYFFEDVIVKIELSKNENMIKRLAILSDDINLSVYVNDCSTEALSNRYFFYSPFFDYNYQND